MSNENKIKIVCIFHNDSKIENEIADSSIYVPILGGKVNYRGTYDNIASIIGDDTGDNISEFNPYINEITVFYWMWKHYEELGNPEYIGVNYYRRFINWTYDDLQPNRILAHKVDLGKSVYGQYEQGHCIDDFDKFNKHFVTILPDNCKKMYFNFLGETYFYNNNMFIMSKENFFEYMELMNKCIGIVQRMFQNQEIDLYQKDMYQRRVYSFILERITGFWIYMKGKTGAEIKEVERHCVQCD